MPACRQVGEHLHDYAQFKSKRKMRRNLILISPSYFKFDGQIKRLKTALR